jgi:mono/diheme cytochrome c family protein
VRATVVGIPVTAAALALAIASLARAQSAGNPGAESLYMRYCADCHGTTGHGDGPAAEDMKPPPYDLTRSTLSREQLIRVIDGRRPIKGHGSGSMPAWGAIFASESGASGERTSAIRLEVFADEVLRLRERSARAPTSVGHQRRPSLINGGG